MQTKLLKDKIYYTDLSIKLNILSNILFFVISLIGVSDHVR